MRINSGPVEVTARFKLFFQPSENKHFSLEKFPTLHEFLSRHSVNGAKKLWMQKVSSYSLFRIVVCVLTFVTQLYGIFSDNWLSNQTGHNIYQCLPIMGSAREKMQIFCWFEVRFKRMFFFCIPHAWNWRKKKSALWRNMNAQWYAPKKYKIFKITMKATKTRTYRDHAELCKKTDMNTTEKIAIQLFYVHLLFISLDILFW